MRIIYAVYYKIMIYDDDNDVVELLIVYVQIEQHFRLKQLLEKRSHLTAILN